VNPAHCFHEIAGQGHEKHMKLQAGVSGVSRARFVRVPVGDSLRFGHTGAMNDSDRLGRLVRERRTQVGFATAQSLAEAAGISSRTLSDIENGRRPSYSRSTLWALDKALQWARGSAQAVLDGGEPTVAASAPAGPVTAAAGGDGVSGGASPSSMDGDVVMLPASALEGLSVEERDEVRAAALAEGLKRAREISAARRLEEASLPDFSQLAARTVRRRPAWEAAQAGADAGEEPQE
jgi:DNA-binding XRE family transcriptional regulator